MTKVAVRSTFASETHGVIATTDSAIVLATNLHEIQYGPLSLSEAARLTEEAGLCLEVSVGTATKNLLSALHVANLKILAEKNFIVHLLWRKNTLTKGAMKKFMWIDARDTIADVHTQRSIKRNALRMLMDGKMKVTEEREFVETYDKR